MDFVVSPPGCGRSVTDFWGWDAHEALLRCPDEVDGDIWIWSTRKGLKPKFTKLPRPWSPRGSSPSRKNPHGRTGNLTWNLMISSQKLLPLDHEAGPAVWSNILCSHSCPSSIADHCVTEAGPFIDKRKYAGQHNTLISANTVLHVSVRLNHHQSLLCTTNWQISTSPFLYFLSREDGSRADSINRTTPHCWAGGTIIQTGKDFIIKLETRYYKKDNTAFLSWL
jgi:hypothetical protein